MHEDESDAILITISAKKDEDSDIDCNMQLSIFVVYLFVCTSLSWWKIDFKHIIVFYLEQIIAYKN